MMRQIKFITGLFVAFLLLFPFSSWAYDFQVDGICYNLSGTEVSVTYRSTLYDSYSGIIIIPDTVTYNGTPYRVTAIGESAFRECKELTQVTIPNSVTTIGSYAFYRSSGLTEVTIGESVTTIGGWAFDECSGLASVTIPNSVTTIGTNAFDYCTGLTELTIGESVETIGTNAFYKCIGLAEVTIPDNVTEIGSAAFAYCTGLTSVTIGNNVTTIGSIAFDGCTGLTSVTIPNSVKTIDQQAFSGCTGLTEITIGNNVTSIGYQAFYDCTGLTSVTIPNSVKTLDDNAFENCTGLTILIIEDGTETLSLTTTISHSHPFKLPLETLYVGRNMDSSSSQLFKDLTTLSSLIIGENVSPISSLTFSGCNNVNVKLLAVEPPETKSLSWTKVEVPMEALLKYAASPYWVDVFTLFAIENDEAYYPVLISYEGDAIITASGGDVDGTVAKKGDVATITPIGDKSQIDGFVIYGIDDITENLTTNGSYSINVSEYYKENIFYSYYASEENKFDITLSQSGQLLDEITISKINDVYYLKVTGDINGTDISAIRRMPNLQILDLSEANVMSGGLAYYEDYETSDNEIGTYFFLDRTNLKLVTLPKSVTTIDSYAFSGCSGIIGIIIPESVVAIDNYAFNGCTNLRILTLEDGIETLSFAASSSATPIKDCPIKTLYLGRNISYNGYQIFKDLTTLTSLTIGERVTYFSNLTFSNCTALITLIFEDGTETLSFPTSSSSTIFTNCPIETLYLGKNISYDSNYSPFKDLTSLKSLTIGENVTSISYYEFYGCSGMIGILTIPNSVKSIGSYAFNGCSGLTEVTIPESVKSIDYSVFGGCTGLTGVTIPNSVTSIGSYAFSGCSGLTELTIPNSVTSIGSYAFSRCSGLTELTIGESVTTIDQYAFNECTGLTEVTIPNSVISIGSSVFSYCSGLTELTIGESVTTIGSYAFSGCSNLMEINSKNPTPPEITSNTFNGVDKEACILNVPIGSLNVYWLHSYWGEFFNIKEVDFPTGIDEVGIDGQTDATEVARYTIDGRQIRGPQKGVNIIRYSDGSVKKVFEK